MAHINRLIQDFACKVLCGLKIVLDNKLNSVHSVNMPRGRQSLTLRPDYLERLEKFRIAERLALPQLKLAMAAPCGWQVIARALEGKPVWEMNYRYIVEWIDRY